MINNNIEDNDIVCFGEEGDEIGRYDRQIVGIERRKIGFDNNDTYKAIITKPFYTNNTMKFYQ